MKHVIFKIVPLINLRGEKIKFSYRDYLLSAVVLPMDGRSADIDETRRSIRLLEVLEKTEKTAPGVDFEDADYEFLCQKVKAMRFQWNDRVFVNFVDDVINAGGSPKKEARKRHERKG